MALPATHIRFAAAIAEYLAVSDRQAYFSGTLYPDSRWVTGIDRRQTHAQRFLDPDYPTDDFTLGWHIHCVCDHIQADIHRSLSPGLSALTAESRWIRQSAGKVVQDMNDAVHADLGDHLPLLTRFPTPNGEAVSDIEAYFGFIRQAYHRWNTPLWKDYARLWTHVGLDRTRILQIEEEVNRIMADSTLVRRLHVAFDRLVADWTQSR
jgi:hypothetical protein